MIPAVLYLVAVVRPRRRLAARAALLLVGFLLPVLGYLGWHQVSYGRFDFVDYDSQFIYGRIAQFVDCTGVSLPRYEQSLCPRQPPAQRNVDFYMWDPRSPQVTLKAPPGMNKGHIILDFDRRILEHQPLTYLKVVAGDILYSFSPVRGDGPSTTQPGTTSSTRTSQPTQTRWLPSVPPPAAARTSSPRWPVS